MIDATDVFQAAADLIRDNYQSLATGDLAGLTIAWGNEAGDEGDLHFRVYDGPETPDTVDLDGASDTTVMMQVTAVTPSGDFTSRNRRMVKWLKELFYVGRRVGPAVVQTLPAAAGPVSGTVDYEVPVTITFRLLT